MASKTNEHFNSSPVSLVKFRHTGVPVDYRDQNHPQYPGDHDVEALRASQSNRKKKRFWIAMCIIGVTAILALVLEGGIAFGRNHPSSFGPQGPKQTSTSIVTVVLTETVTSSTQQQSLDLYQTVTETVLITRTSTSVKITLHRPEPVPLTSDSVSLPLLPITQPPSSSMPSTEATPSKAPILQPSGKQCLDQPDRPGFMDTKERCESACNPRPEKECAKWDGGWVCLKPC
ncbi:hypothetical protein EJ04DRAFT_565962 [Polyplosphaeria fusca]|uniref:Uncharacterized protein n=1 Tax=Polyplosphaeria fusca TaxID=682080 RepID=A0A9P4QX08_9PLEO|nr:hypothetical protein EJ04DRAFT_565962 [Polyplosphaeria fusca]